MDRISANLIGGVAGLLLAALFIISIPLILASGGEPAFDAPTSAWLAYYRGSHNLTVLGIYLSLELPCFVLFVGGIWVRLRAADDMTRLAAVVLLIGAGATLTMRLSSGAANVAAAIRVERGLDLSEAGALADMATGFFVMSWISLGTALFAGGVGILRSGAFPRLLGWVAIVGGVANLVAPAVPLTNVWGVALLAYYVWVVAISVDMLRVGVRRRHAG